MPPQTGLQFFRKKQTIEDLSLERPQSLQSFYEAVEQSLKGIEQKLKRLEFSFYGPGDVEEEIKRWLPALEVTMKFAKIGKLHCKPQLQDLFDLYNRSIGDPTMVVLFDKECVQTVLELINKVLTYLETGFQEITKPLESILDYMRKYCLSFVGTDGDPYLETATNYEKQRQDLAQAIKINVDDIRFMAEKFETTGLEIHELGSVPKKIAEKCECWHIPLLVMFPGACENIRNACSGVHKWIQADQGYLTFIHNDVLDIEKKKEDQSRLLRDVQIKCSHLDHEMKVCKRDIADCVNELRRMSSKETMVKRQFDSVQRELHNINLDIEVKTFRLDQIKKSISEPGIKNNFDKLNAEVEILTSKAPSLKRKLDDLKKKLEFFNIKRDVKEKREAKILEIKQEMKVSKKELRKLEIEMERLQINLAKLREIHRFKTSQDVLKKLFYNMPLSNKGPLALLKKKDTVVDKLEKASRIVARNIEGDWTKMYRHLPFHPPRGEENIRTDIDEIWTNFMRETQETQAKHCLLKWRRVHNKARINDLMETLLKIHRKDIAAKIETEILKKSPPGGPLVQQMQSFQRTTPQSPTKLVRFPKMPVSHSQMSVSRRSGVFS